jgi:ribonuclease R/exosome complex exonuclease DIS3/RRP44
MSKKKESLLIKILQILGAHPNKSFNYKQIASKLEFDSEEIRRQIQKDLQKLLKQNKIEETSKGKFRIVPKKIFVGVMDMTQNGSGFAIVEGLEKDIYVPNYAINKALHGDLVEVEIIKQKPGKNPQGEVVKILERAKTHFAGIVKMFDHYAFIDPDDVKMYKEIFVKKSDLNGAKNGEKVVVEMYDWPEKVGSPIGRVIKVLGQPGEHEVEIHAILDQYDLPYEFDPEVQKAAESLPKEITASEIKKRRDMRDTITFTIDPFDAKDFDDALSVKKLDNGRYEIGIHIADVSHYLKPGTLLDKEAYNRATSVYLVDRVVPMLPEVLSNELCSLRPHEDKLTYSAVFEMDEEGKVYKEWYGRTVTHSDRRFTYEEAQAIIEGAEGDFKEEILLLDKIAKKLRKKRFQNGALSFDRIEVRFKVDDKGNPIEVYFKESKDSNKLIEEFMLLANRKVAEFVTKKIPPKEKTFVYRVHDEPAEEKLMELKTVVQKFGYDLDLKDRKSIIKSINNLLYEVKDKPEENMIETLTIRSMSKAVYTTDNRGHYGLAFDYYTHFTSPIRRYPDVMVHRLLQNYLDRKKSPSKEEYEKKCIHSTNMEIQAATAERDSIKYMQAKYIEDFKDVIFDGVITGVTEWGIYVELVENKVEGLVRRTEMRDDYYYFDEDQYALIGEITGKKYVLGDLVKVKVKKTNPIKKQIDFELIYDSVEDLKNIDKKKNSVTKGNPNKKKGQAHKKYKKKK